MHTYAELSFSFGKRPSKARRTFEVRSLIATIFKGGAMSGCWELKVRWMCAAAGVPVASEIVLRRGTISQARKERSFRDTEFVDCGLFSIAEECPGLSSP